MSQNSTDVLDNLAWELIDASSEEDADYQRLSEMWAEVEGELESAGHNQAAKLAGQASAYVVQSSVRGTAGAETINTLSRMADYIREGIESGGEFTTIDPTDGLLEILTTPRRSVETPGDSGTDPLFEHDESAGSELTLDKIAASASPDVDVESIMAQVEVATGEPAFSESASTDADATEPATDVQEAPASRKAPAADDLSLISHDPEMMVVFVSEANEHLDAAEPHLLELENDPSLADSLDAVFRSFHSVKGTAGFMELSEIGDVAHAAEDLLDMARDGEIALQGDVMELCLQSLDWLRSQVEEIGQGATEGRPHGVRRGPD